MDSPLVIVAEWVVIMAALFIGAWWVERDMERKGDDQDT